MPNLTAHAPRGWLREGLRVPLWIYRLHLGWLLGERFLRLTHIGRTTGLPHQTVLEVVRHDKENRIFVVVSGWGEQSDWLKNIKHNPAVQITVGARTFKAHAEFLSPEQVTQELTEYARVHAVAYRELSELLLGKRAETPQEFQDQARTLRMVAFHVQAAT